MVDAEGPIPERYAEATRLLAQLHAAPRCRSVLPVADGREHVMPPYDLEAFLIEVELLLDWYVPHIIGTHLSGSARAEFVNALDGAPGRCPGRARHLDLARLSLAEPDLAARARGAAAASG